MSNLKQLINTFKKAKSLEEKKDLLFKISQSPSTDSLIFLFHIMEDSDIGLKTIAHKHMQSVRVKLIEQGEDVDTSLKIAFVKKFLGKYQSAKNKNEKLEALKKLSKIKTPIIFKQLTGIINNEKDYFILGVILKLIARNGESRAIPILKVFLNQPDVTLRIAAIEAFSYIESADLSEILSELIIDPEPKIALKVCELLWNHQPILIRNKVLEVIKTGKKNVKLLLIEILKKISTFDAKNFLLMLSEDHEVGIKAREYSDSMAIKYDSSQDNLVIDELSTKKESNIFEEIENEKNLEIQIKKLSSIYRIKSEKILKFCCTLIEKTTSKFLISSLVKNIPEIAKSLNKTENIKKLIMPYLNHQDERVRANAVEGLSAIADVDIIQSILKIIENDISHRVISAAANFLLEIAHEKVISRLSKMAKDGNFSQKNSVLFVIDSKIDKIQKNDIEKILGILCSDQNFEIVKKAKGLLYKAKTSASKKKNSTQNIEFNAEDSVADRINQILELEEIPADIIESQFNILENANSPKNDKLKSIRALSALVITEKHRKRFSAQLEHFNDDAVLLSALILAVGRVSGKDITAKLKNYLNHSDSRIRANTIEILGEILEDEIEIDTIVTPLLSDKDYRVIANAIKILYTTDKEKALDKISSMLKNPDKKSRNSGIFAIREINDPALIEILKLHVNDPDMEVAIHAGYAMIELEKSLSNPNINIDGLSTEKQLLKLLDIFQFGNVYSRKTSIEKISSLMIEDNIKSIASVLSQTDNNYIQSLLVKLVGLTESNNAIPIIKPFLTNENERVRANAVEGLAMIQSQQVPFILGNLIMKERDSRTLANIIIGISNFSLNDAEDYLKIIRKKKMLDDEHVSFLKNIIANERKAVENALADEIKSSKIKEPVEPQDIIVDIKEDLSEEIVIEKAKITPKHPETDKPDAVELEIRKSEKTKDVEIVNKAQHVIVPEIETPIQKNKINSANIQKEDRVEKQTEIEKKKPQESLKDKYSGIRKKTQVKISTPEKSPQTESILPVKSDNSKQKIIIAIAAIVIIALGFVIYTSISISSIDKIKQHIKNGKYTDAKQLLDKQSDKDTNANLVYLAIYIHLENGNYDIADSCITKGLSIEPDSERFIKIKKIVDEAKNNNSKNIKIDIAKINDTTSGVPDSKKTPVIQSLSNVFHSMMMQWCKAYYVPNGKIISKSKLTSKLKNILKNAQEDIANNKPKEAEKSFRKIISLKTHNATVWKIISKYYYNINNFKNSLTGFLYSYELNQIRKKDKLKFLKSKTIDNIAALFFRKKYYCDALICNLIKFEAKPEAIISLKIASLLECTKDSKSLSVKSFPDFIEFCNFGSTVEIKKWMSETEKLLINSKQIITFFNFLSKNNHKDKIEHYIDYFSNKITAIGFIEYTIEFYLQSGNYAKSIKKVSLALKKYPKSKILLTLIGKAYSKLKKYKLSNTFLEKAIALDPDLIEPTELILYNYDKLNDTSKLRKYCQNLVDSGSKTVYPYLKLAELNTIAKNFEDAFINYYKALSLAKNEQEIKKVKVQLDELKKKMKTSDSKVVSATKIIKKVKINSIKDLKKNTDDLINLYEEE